MQQMHFLQHIGHRLCDFRIMAASRMRLIVILIAFLPWNCVVWADGQSAVNSLINLQKRIDYRTCIDRFDVHRDTIIQTDDSRAMGATFLYHVQAANRDECLRVCCDTDRCDVFVFEEKFQGSCFLFQCGPPDDFRCQFAAHANYSIAVMSVQRYKELNKAPAAVIPPQPVVHLSQHEKQLEDLKNYRMPEMGSSSKFSSGQSQLAALPPTTSTTTTTTTPSVTTVTPSVCGRFQFRCHSGECIAIYNACDGIPQCEDGSDETPACPSQPVAMTKGNNKKQKSQMEEPPPLYRSNPSVQLQQLPHVNNNNNYAVDAVDRSRPVPNAGKLYEGSEGYMSGTIEKPPPLMRNREDPVSANGRYYNNKNIPMPSNNMQIQDTMNGNSNNNNLIYNTNLNDPYQTHLNRLPNANDLSGGGGSSGVGGRPMDNYYPNSYRDKYFYPSNNQQMAQPQSPLQPVQFPNGPPNPNPPFNYNNNLQPQNYLPSNTNNNGNINNNNNNWPASIANNNLPPAAVVVSKSSNQPLVPNPPAAVAPQPAPSQPQQVKVPVKAKPKAKEEEETTSDEDSNSDEETGMPTFPPIYQQLKAMGSELDGEFIDHDGHSDRPTGAVVSLVIGVSLTAVLAIFIGCRMKTVGRRIRRTGKGPYAHDADFLVNGMYL